MIKKLAITSSLAMSTLTTTLHFVSHGYVKLETYAISKAQGYYANTIAGLAKDLGYEKPRPELPALDRMTLLREECKDRNQVPLSLARAVMKHESNDNQYAESHAGAIGLMQVMPFHVKTCGLMHESQLYDEKINIACGCDILGKAYKNQSKVTRNGKRVVDTIKVLQEYNGGAKGIGKSAENQDYPYLVFAELE